MKELEMVGNEMENRKKPVVVLITGVAGFIGSFLAKALLEQEAETVQVIGVDNLNSYYDSALKRKRLLMVEEAGRKAAEHQGEQAFYFVKADISQAPEISEVFERYHPAVVINLAAQAGVRYSIDHPEEYIKTNLVGFFHVLEECRKGRREGWLKHFIFASSSSVYGDNEQVPYRVEDKTELPVSLYAATKKSDELMARSYSRLYEIPTTGLRFFTVYGPMGRPDMAYFSFTEKILSGKPIVLYNYGDMKRDFTYIDDVVNCVMKIFKSSPPSAEIGCPFAVYNIGNSRPENLKEFVDILEVSLQRAGLLKERARREYLPMQPGDVYQTYADMTAFEQKFGKLCFTDLREGLEKFAEWYKIEVSH